MFLYAKFPLLDGWTVAVAISKNYISATIWRLSGPCSYIAVWIMWFCIYRTFANSKHVLLNTNQASSLKIGISLCLTFTVSKDENYFLQSRKYSEFSFILYPTGIFMIFLFCFDIFLSVLQRVLKTFCPVGTTGAVLGHLSQDWVWAYAVSCPMAYA